ncbi:CAMK family protein kinase [Histomonas meleagridis]|uniref:CAMK family protein kinase n=1 Tax=Histomonas meleagridis TaxID=135588 RepID=UPI0035597FDA|nr:CAMK family protein kinase [Histomonas meleagridis]KAH0802623.1 CAMK family protein kinase [Histomonas meleagridis]
MGGNASANKEAEQPYKEFTVHPLLSTIENPINRFYDDFASSLVDDISQPIIDPMYSTEIEEITGYTINRVIGSGAEAIVFEGFKTENSSIHFAIKKYREQPHLGPNGYPREFEISNYLDHPRCIKLIDCFKDNNSIITVMPLAKHGSVTQKNVPVVTVCSGILFLSQIGSALSHMHSRNIVHRDIKPGNILIWNDGFMLCDYSVSSKLSSDEDKLSGIVGTSIFMAPEISNNMYDPKATDIWALGVTLFVLLFGKYPYNLEEALKIQGNHQWNNTALISKCVQNNQLKFPEFPILPKQFKAIIERMLERDPTKRIKAHEIAENKWLKKKAEDWKLTLSCLSF